MDRIYFEFVFFYILNEEFQNYKFSLFLKTTKRNQNEWNWNQNCEIS